MRAGNAYHVGMDTAGTPDAVRALVEAGCLGTDPLPWLLASGEPYAVWAALTGVMRRPATDAAVTRARGETLARPEVLQLIEQLPAKPSPATTDHHSPSFLPNRLNLLAEMGVTRGDSQRVDAILGVLLESQDRAGRYRVSGPSRPRPLVDSHRCDNNAIVDVLARYGYAQEPSVARALVRVGSDLTTSAQGQGWCCIPDRQPMLRLAMRRADACPQITLEGLRCIGRVPAARRPRGAADAARTPLEIWRRRAEERPYQFGHGYQFKTIRWPSFWYDVLSVLDAVSSFPELWQGPDARDEDRQALAELAACLIAYNVDAAGRVTPRRTHRGYDHFSFGDKSAPSPFATARVLAVLTRFADLAEQIAAVDVEALPSSKGGSGTAVPPETAAPAAVPEACPMPSVATYDPARVLPRILTRHHLDRPWEQQSPESIVADTVALLATDPATPYLSLAARIPAFDSASLEQSLDRRHSLVRWRGMRGVLQVFRRDFVPIVFAATSPQVIRYARTYAHGRGVDSKTYEHWAPRVLEACSEEPLSRSALRSRLRPPADLGAILSLMTAEGILVRAHPERDRTDRRMTYAPRDAILPGVELDRISQDEGRAQVLRAYVRGYGPVTQRDAAWWTGMDLKRVKRAMEALEDEIVEIALKGSEGSWLMHAADAEELERATLLDQPSIAVLPANDPLMIGYADRSRFVDDIARPYVFDAAQNAAPVVLQDGKVVAVWDAAHPPSAKSHAAEAMLFAVAPIEAESLAAIHSALARTVGSSVDVASRITHVAGMHSLVSRPIGAYAHPLR